MMMEVGVGDEERRGRRVEMAFVMPKKFVWKI